MRRSAILSSASRPPPLSSGASPAVTLQQQQQQHMHVPSSSTARPTPTYNNAAAAASSFSSAPTGASPSGMVEFRCLFSTQLMKKRKTWQDGLLRVFPATRRCTVIRAPSSDAGGADDLCGTRGKRRLPLAQGGAAVDGRYLSFEELRGVLGANIDEIEFENCIVTIEHDNTRPSAAASKATAPRTSEATGTRVQAFKPPDVIAPPRHLQSSHMQMPNGGNVAASSIGGDTVRNNAESVTQGSRVATREAHRPGSGLYRVEDDELDGIWGTDGGAAGGDSSSSREQEDGTRDHPVVHIPSTKKAPQDIDSSFMLTSFPRQEASVSSGHGYLDDSYDSYSYNNTVDSAPTGGGVDDRLELLAERGYFGVVVVPEEPQPPKRPRLGREDEDEDGGIDIASYAPPPSERVEYESDRDIGPSEEEDGDAVADCDDADEVHEEEDDVPLGFIDEEPPSRWAPQSTKDPTIATGIVRIDNAFPTVVRGEVGGADTSAGDSTRRHNFITREAIDELRALEVESEWW